MYKMYKNKLQQDRSFKLIRFVLAFFAKIIRETIDLVKITSKYTRGHSFKYTISLLRGVGLV